MIDIDEAVRAGRPGATWSSRARSSWAEEDWVPGGDHETEGAAKPHRDPLQETAGKCPGQLQPREGKQHKTTLGTNDTCHVEQFGGSESTSLTSSFLVHTLEKWKVDTHCGNWKMLCFFFQDMLQQNISSSTKTIQELKGDKFDI